MLLEIDRLTMEQDSLKDMTLESLIELCIMTSERLESSKINHEAAEITAFYQRTLQDVHQVIVEKRTALPLLK
ncbi:MAG TPA: hypothetical protein VF487_04715 [Chitinophagaceae bacterium]